ncbi:Elicitor-responsive protein 1 [Morella rubra]|uniref:Elicitor-responsive protein 1 n=1 Tax=Morella rubra TaxID=262757 RepID=A0A6A1WJT9_9ROSI|nr:Elicitor-responsive protein 1 [Morella rubra]
MASGILEVLLVDAEGIRDKDFIEKMNPYLVMRYGNQECTSDLARGEGKKRVWNEKFTFKAEYPGDEDHKIYLKDVVSLGVETGKMELRRGKYRVVLPDKTYSGEICVGVTCTANV